MVRFGIVLPISQKYQLVYQRLCSRKIIRCNGRSAIICCEYFYFFFILNVMAFASTRNLFNFLDRSVSSYHMKAFHEPATSHYIRASQMFYSTLVKKPALFFLSKSDPIGAVSSNEQLRASWESLGISCDWKCWEKSPHVGHFMKHREEYIFSLHNFLQSLNMVQHPEKMRIRAQN